MPETRAIELPPEVVPRVSETIAVLVPDDLESQADRTRFLAALELAYLTAAADGLDAAERDLLAEVLERATGARIDQSAFREHFADLEETAGALGRRHRLARSAAELETEEARTDALRFAALVAMADGRLGPPELSVLGEIGSFFEWSPDRVRRVLDSLVATLRGAP